MTPLKLPNFDKVLDKNKQITRLDVRKMYAGLESERLEVIKNHSLMYAINRTKRHLKEISELLAPENVIPQWEEYNKELRELHERLSGGKTIENPMTGEKMWNINYGSKEYNNGLKELKERYSIDAYDAYMKGDFDEPIDKYIHFVNEKEVDPKVDVPDYGVMKLIHFLWKEEK